MWSFGNGGQLDGGCSWGGNGEAYGLYDQVLYGYRLCDVSDEP